MYCSRCASVVTPDATVRHNGLVSSSHPVRFTADAVLADGSAVPGDNYVLTWLSAKGGAVWLPASASGGAVSSVNAKTGDVVLSASDVGADASGAAAAVTASSLGLGSVNNTSDAGKPVSTAQQAALDLKAALASPALTGTPTVPTAVVGTNTTQAASTAFVLANGGGATVGFPCFSPYSGAVVPIPFGAGQTSQTIQPANGTLFYVPLVITNSPTLTAVSVKVTTGAGAGGVFRAGLFSTTAGKPGTLLNDFGTAAITAIAVSTIGSLSVAMTPGLYWIGVVAQGAPSPLAIFLGNNAGIGVVANNSVATALSPATYVGLTQTSVTGALSNAAPNGLASVANSTTPLIAVTF